MAEKTDEVSETLDESPEELRWTKRTKQKCLIRDEAEEKQRKKRRMRTASDVVSRILWDEELPSENFVVGYLDRFAGLVEKSFECFSWEDLASVDDHFVLAIPKHRIVYFRYRDTPVWNKTDRSDLVFGSTSDGEAVEDIREVVRRLDREFRENLAKKDDDVTGWSSDASSDDSSDIVRVFAPLTASKSEPPEESWRRAATAANYFVAMRVTDPDILTKVSDIKWRICDKEPRMIEILMPNHLLHVTVAMLRLDDPDEVVKAVDALKRCRNDVQSERPVRVRLAGLSTFRGRVLYVKADASDRFYELRRSVLRHLNDAGIGPSHDDDDDSYVPHMTLVKLTRSRVQLLQNPFIDPFLYVGDVDCDLGVQPCDALHLCSIGDDRRPDDFYSCEAEVRLH